MSPVQFTTIESIGREKLIDRIGQSIELNNPDVIKGIGDDAAVFRLSDFEAGLLTSETFVEGVDFDLSYMPLHHLGAKVVHAAISDVYAMNGEATAVLVNLALPNKISVEMVEQFYVGIHQACRENETQLAGGDITASHSTMVVTVSVYGKAALENITYRSTAKPDEAICVTGDLGGALAGLKILMREKQLWEESEEEEFTPDLNEYEYVVKRQLLPYSRRDLVDALRGLELVPGAMIDLSQSLIRDLSSLCKASGVGAYLYEAALPIAVETRAVADELKQDVIHYALYGGEDYEILFTLSEKEVERFAKVFNDFVVIGRVTPATEGIKMQTGTGDMWVFEEKI